MVRFLLSLLSLAIAGLVLSVMLTLYAWVGLILPALLLPEFWVVYILTLGGAAVWAVTLASWWRLHTRPEALSNCPRWVRRLYNLILFSAMLSCASSVVVILLISANGNTANGWALFLIWGGGTSASFYMTSVAMLCDLRETTRNRRVFRFWRNR
jgi:hypothetical protein